MAKFEQKDNSGVMFKNDRKEMDKHPDRKGEALIGGVAYWVAGWLKEGKNGQFLSLAFTPKDEQRGSTSKSAEKPTAGNMRDDVPW